MIPKAKWARPKCFTLIELIVVLVILGVLAALAIPTFNAVRNRGAETVALSDATTVARAATTIYALYDGKSGPINERECTPNPDDCSANDAVQAAALESGFVVEGSTLTKGDTVLEGDADPWKLVAGEGSDNLSVACITFTDQAFTAERIEITTPGTVPSCP